MRRRQMRGFLAARDIVGLGIGVGALAARRFAAQVLDLEWRFLPEYAGASGAACITMTPALGFASTWRALGRKAAPLLRVE